MTVNILLVSDGIVHPPLLGRYWLRRALRTIPGTSLQSISSLDALPGLPLERFQGMVLYVHHESISSAALAALDAFVWQGSGLMAIHSATASFKQEAGYFDILGGRFTTHGPVQTFQVEPALTQEPIFGDIATFQVRDELYLHEYDPANQVHLHAEFEGEWQPIVWTRSYGQGRVSYCSLGHRAATVRHPAVQAIVQRGLIWACGMEP